MSTRKTKPTKTKTQTKPRAPAAAAPAADPAALIAAPSAAPAETPGGFEVSEMEARALDEADRIAKEAYALYSRKAVALVEVLADVFSSRSANAEATGRVRDTLAAAVHARGLPTDTGGWRYTPGTRKVERIEPGK